MPYTIRSPWRTVVLVAAFLSALWPLGPALAARPGEMAPLFKGETLDGETVDFGALRGSAPILLVFWASWCPTCRKEVPRVNELWVRYRERGFVVLGVNVGLNDTPDRARAFVRRYRMAYPVIFDEGSNITRRYGVFGVPTMVLVDRSGKVVEVANQVPDLDDVAYDRLDR